MSNTHFGDACSFSGGFSFTKCEGQHTQKTLVCFKVALVDLDSKKKTQTWDQSDGRNLAPAYPIIYKVYISQVVQLNFIVSPFFTSRNAFSGQVNAMSSDVQDREKPRDMSKSKLQILQKKHASHDVCLCPKNMSHFRNHDIYNPFSPLVWPRRQKLFVRPVVDMFSCLERGAMLLK